MADDMNNEKQSKPFCMRCCLPIEPADVVDIGGHVYHKNCCCCCMCRAIPTTVKMHFGHVFCDNCYSHCFDGDGENGASASSSDFFKNCYDRCRDDPQFAANMRQFMGNGCCAFAGCGAPPNFFRAGQPPFCRFGEGHPSWFPPNEEKKCHGAFWVRCPNGMCWWSRNCSNRWVPSIELSHRPPSPWVFYRKPVGGLSFVCRA